MKKKINKKERKKIRIKSEIVKKRFIILIMMIVFAMSLILINLYHVQVIKQEFFISEVSRLSESEVSGTTAPRGRIYDRNHKLVVDNKSKKVIFYKKQNNVSIAGEIDTAYKIGEMIDIDYDRLTDSILKDFWLANNISTSDELITSEEWRMLDERKMTRDEINSLKKERVTEEHLSTYNETDLETAYIYHLMNKGYSYEEKIIKDFGISDEEYAFIAENLHMLPGIDVRLDWEREYLYGDVFKSIIGNVSKVPFEMKDYYLEKGYSLDDLVGTSYLEYIYDDYLKGEKNQYRIKNGDIKLEQFGKRGNDIVLTIDIELQKAVENILTYEIKNAKSEPNTEYFDKSFVIITNPNTGEILAMAGKQLKNGEIVDYTPGVITSSVVPGSIVKGASHIVGYNTNSLYIGEYRDDSCIKIAATPQKCSWSYLGVLDDITALALSSNTYQFHTAMRVGGAYYQYNAGLSVRKEAFDIYRKTFSEFGLGIKTGIDLPNEKLGFTGSSTASGHLLDFSIGQYDTYTPIQIAQYISTIATGNRMQPYLLKEVYSSEENLESLLYKKEPVVLNKVTTEWNYINRIREGFKAVMDWGLGWGFMDNSFSPAGKTGTSQSFIDTDGDGAIDKETLSTNFIGYAPYDNPAMSFAVISPDVTHYYNGYEYQTLVNKRISYEVSKKYFEIFK